SIARKLVPNVAYQGAKILSYMLVGLLLGTVGAAFNLDAARPYVMFVAGAFMILIGLGMTGRFPWAANLTPKPPRFLITALSRVRRKANSDAAAGGVSLATPISMGLLTGLFPCAPLISAQLTAAASGSPTSGAIGMLAFGLGTAPLMLGFGTASSLLPARLKERAMVVLAVVVIGFGLVYLNRGAMLTGFPVNSNTIKAAVLGSPSTDVTAEEYPTAADGVVEVPLTISNVTFQPAALNIPADKPVRLVVDRQEDNACSDQLAIPQLGVLVDLKPFATTVVDIPASAAGSYTLTCGMGMMSGQIVVGAPAAASGGVSPVMLSMLLAAALGGGVIVRARRGSAKPAAKAPKGSPAPQGAPAFLGLRPNELIIAAGATSFAVFAGLALGGFFN
ncbi:MAG: urease accessory protein UreH domain-containing protein, partial [Coriobacteriia bacterium]